MTTSRRYLLFLLAGLIVVLGGIGFFKKQNPVSSYETTGPRIRISSIIKSKLSSLKTENREDLILQFMQLNSKLNVLIFFSLDDCPACLYEAEFWGATARLFDESDVLFWGIIDENESGKVPGFLNEYRIDFPILYDSNGQFRREIVSLKQISRLGTSSPFKLFVNNFFEVVHIEGPTKDPDEQILFSNRVTRIFKSLEKKIN